MIKKEVLINFINNVPNSQEKLEAIKVLIDIYRNKF
jgi:hypothetical protein